MSTLLIKNGRIIDPVQGWDQVGSLLIRNGQVTGLCAESIDTDEVIDAQGLIVCPGLVDLRASLREPGHEEDETIASGTQAALAGGFTTIACPPDTHPPVDNRAAAEFVILQAARANNCKVVPLGAITKNLKGEELAEIGQLVAGGAAAFCDGKKPLNNAEVMRRALEYTRMFSRSIMHAPQVPELIADGIVNEGYTSMLLGMPSMPAAAETIMIHRDLALAEMTEGTLHLMGVTTAEGVEQIRRAKQRGVKVTADVTPHHLYFTDESFQTFDSRFKVNPPLRTTEDIDALIEGLRDGTIDAICSDHEPYAQEKVDCELDQTPFGVVGLETTLFACIHKLVGEKGFDWSHLIRLLSWGPASILQISAGSLEEGAAADITIFDPEANFQVDSNQFHSCGRRTAFEGMQLSGQIRYVIVDGVLKYCQA